MQLLICYSASISLSGFVTVSGSSATLTLSSSVSGSFQCSLDGGDFESCKFVSLTKQWQKKYKHL